MPSGLVLHQVGGAVLAFPKSELTNSYGNTSRGKNTEFYSTMNPLVRDTQYLQKERKLKYKGFAFDLQNYSFESFDNYIRQIVGKPVPVIAYVLHDNEAKRFGCNCKCSTGKGCCGLTFMQAIAVITDVDNINEKDWASPRDFGFTIELVTAWRGIDRLKWKYGGASLNGTVTPITTTKSLVKAVSTRVTTNYDYAQETALPNCASFFQDCKVCNASFSPVVYDDECRHLWDIEALSWRLQKGCCESNSCCIGNVGFVMEGANRGVAYDLDINPDYWNVPPLSLYIFKGINGESDIKINSKGTDSRLAPISRQTVIDIATTNVLLANNGYSDIDDDDLVVVGDFSYYNGTELLKNSMIVRNGDAIDVQPIVRQPDYFAGMVHPSFDARVSAIGDFDGFDMAHYFRRY